MEARLTRFFCPVVTCKRNEESFTRLDNFLRHMRKQHKGNNKAFEKAMAQREDDVADENEEMDTEIRQLEVATDTG